MNRSIKLQLKLGFYGLVFTVTSFVLSIYFEDGFDSNRGLINGFLNNNESNQYHSIIKKNHVIFIESLPLEWLFQNQRLLHKNDHEFHQDLLKKIGFEEVFQLNSTAKNDQNTKKISNYFVQETKPTNSISNKDLVIEFLLGVSMQNLVNSNYNQEEAQFFQNYDSLLNQVTNNNKTCQFIDSSFPNLELSQSRNKIASIFQSFCSSEDIQNEGKNISDSQLFSFYYFGSGINQQIELTSEQYKDELVYAIQQIQKIKNNIQKDEQLTIISLVQNNSQTKKLCQEVQYCIGFALQYYPSFEFSQNVFLDLKEKVKLVDISTTLSLISGVQVPLLSQGRFLNSILNNQINLSKNQISELNANYNKINLHQLNLYYEQVQLNSQIFDEFETIQEQIKQIFKIEDNQHFIEKSSMIINKLIDQEFTKINPYQTQLMFVTTVTMITLVVVIFSALLYYNIKLQLTKSQNYGLANIINQTDLIIDKKDRASAQIHVNTFLQGLFLFAYFIQKQIFLNSPKCIFFNLNQGKFSFEINLFQNFNLIKKEKYFYQETISDQFFLFICFISIISLQAAFFTYIQQIQEARRYLFLTIYLAIITVLFFLSIDDNIQKLIQSNSIVTLLEQNLFYCGIQLQKYYFVYKISLINAQNSSRIKKYIKIITFVIQDLLFFVPQLLETVFKISIYIDLSASFIINVIILTAAFFLLEKSNYQSTLVIFCFNCINFISQSQFVQDSTQKIEYLFCYSTIIILFVLVINQLNMLTSISGLIGVYLIKNIFFALIFKNELFYTQILNFDDSNLQQICFICTEISIIAIISMMTQLKDEVKQKYGIIFFFKSNLIDLRYIYDILKYIIFYFIHLVILQINILLQIERGYSTSKSIYPKINAYQKVSSRFQTILITSILLVLIQIYIRKQYFQYRSTKSEIMKTEEEIMETDQQITLQEM